MNDSSEALKRHVADLFMKAGSVPVLSVEVKTYPEETNLVVYVDPGDLQVAVDSTEAVETELAKSSDRPSFVVVRKAKIESFEHETSSGVTGVHDNKASELVRLVSARSRVSSAEPSLVYVPDARVSLTAVTANRHHLIFGRRGAGKTALLVEARRTVEERGDISSWTNIQSLRREEPQRVLLFVLQDLFSSLISNRSRVAEQSHLALALSELYARIAQLLAKDTTSLAEVERMIPRVQRAISQYLEVEGVRVFLFLDDFYYLPRAQQPDILDMLHGSIRESSVWLKIASIRHLTNWWRSSPPVGLQTGQDAELLDLDVTLQNPERAAIFLEGLLSAYARRVGISALSRIFNKPSLERLVLASGAVPRDYMVLAGSSITRAQRRPNARVTGVQDVNQAAGDAAGAKLQELEEDMASNSGGAETTLATLNTVRAFCLEEKSYTYFLVGYREKEERPKEYSLLTDLMDVRLIHLVDASVSDSHIAGQRSEAYMLDLSQFSGSRLKQKLHVLDFIDGKFVSRETRNAESTRIGGSVLELIAILRRAPTFELASLTALVSPVSAEAGPGEGGAAEEEVATAP